MRKRNKKSKKWFLVFWAAIIISLAAFLIRKTGINLSAKDIPLLSPLSESFFIKNDSEILKQAGIEISGSLIEEENALVATLSSGTTVFFKKGEEIEQKLPSLQLILKNIKMEGRWPVKIDLRFTRPVIGY